MSTTTPSLLERIAPLFPYPAEITGSAVAFHLDCTVPDACRNLTGWMRLGYVERVRRGVYVMSESWKGQPRYIIKQLAAKGPVTGDSVHAATGQTANAAKNLLLRMTAEGVLVAHHTKGPGRGFNSYTLAPECAVPVAGKHLADAEALELLLAEVELDDFPTRSVPRLIGRPQAEARVLTERWEREGWIANSSGGKCTLGPRWLKERARRAAE